MPRARGRLRGRHDAGRGGCTPGAVRGHPATTTSAPRAAAARRIAALLLLLPGLTLEFAPAAPGSVMAVHRAAVGRAASLQDPQRRLRRARPSGAPPVGALPGGAVPGAADLDLDRRAIEAIVEALQGPAASDKVVTRHLRQLGRSINNQQRATFARRVLGVSVLRRVCLHPTRARPPRRAAFQCSSAPSNS